MKNRGHIDKGLIFKGQFFNNMHYSFYRALSSTPIYRLFLRNRKNINFHPLFQNPWPGSQLLGRSVLKGFFFSQGRVYDQTELANYFKQPDQKTQLFYDYYNSFDWLEDLRSISDNTTRRHARNLIVNWISENKRWKSKSWSTEVMGKRLCNWLGLFDFFATSAPEDFRRSLFKSMTSQYKHLCKIVVWETDLDKKIIGLIGILFALLAVPNYSAKEFKKWMNALDLEMQKKLIFDGDYSQTRPTDLFNFLKRLVDLRSLLRAHKLQCPGSLQNLIAQCVPIVRLFRHGDGRLAFLEDSHAIAPNVIDMVLSIADVKGRPALRTVSMGYERCSSNRQLIIFRSLNTHVPLACSQLKYDLNKESIYEINGLDFDWSLGKDRLILKADILCCWQDQGDQNNQNDLAPWAGKVSVKRIFEDESIFLESHVHIHNQVNHLDCSRQLYLVGDQDNFRAADMIQSDRDMTVGLRFVFPKGAQIQIKPNLKGAMIRIQNDTLMWDFLVRGADEIFSDQVDFPLENMVQECPCLMVLKSVEANQKEQLQWAFNRC